MTTRYLLALIVTTCLILVFLKDGSDESVPDFSGVWQMWGTDKDFEHKYSNCWLEIEQHADRVSIRAWSEEDAWTSNGRGKIENNKLRFRWAGKEKGWRGTAVLELVGDTLKGTHQREGEHTALQYCQGVQKDSTQ